MQPGTLAADYIHSFTSLKNGMNEAKAERQWYWLLCVCANLQYNELHK